MNTLRVLLADDDPEVLAALADLIATDPGLEVVGMAGNTVEAVAVASRVCPDVSLMDVKMPGGGGPDATAAIRQMLPDSHVVAVSAYHDRTTVMEMLAAGAVGYVTKGSPPEEILQAVHRAAQGLAPLSPVASTELVNELGRRLREEHHAQQARLAVEERLHAAIDGDLTIVLQPIIELATSRLTEVEALSRFRGPGGPDVWFAQAEELGLTVELERTAFHAALSVVDRLPEDVSVGINLSPGSIVHPGFWDDVPRQLLPRVILEITEHTAVQDYDELRATLAPLRAAGIRLAVDDAGAGFASLRHMLMLEADIIKIDASIIRDLHQHQAQRALAATLITFARQTDAVVVAEGIETPAELEVLRHLGVDFGQGYLLGRPAPPDDVVASLGAKAATV